MEQTEFDRIGVFANQAAVAIKNAQLYEDLRKSQSEYELILLSAGEGIYGLDQDGRTTFVNPAAAQLLGWQAEDLIGRPQHDLIHHTRSDGSTYDRSQCPIYAALKDGQVHTVNDEVFWRKDGTSLTVEYTSTPIRDATGQPAGAVVTFRDITRRIEAEQGQREALAQVEKLKDRLQEENAYLQEEIRLEHDFDNIISGSESFKAVLRSVEQVASTESTVLILGETGTGKELIARALHTLSPRQERPLVKVNCAALPANLIESELFGHERGAFTGALSRRQGRFELAHRGTIFLDEIGDLPLDLQAKLLRVLQEGEFERLGGSQTLEVDVRVIAATNRDLEAAARAGDFREDLFYRLNVFPIWLPPLRERAEDIPLLVRHFVDKASARVGKRITAIPQRVMTALQNYEFPGNIRELENIVERAMILTRDQTLRLDQSLELLLKGPPGPQDKDVTLEQVERQHILHVLGVTNWRIEGPKGAAIRLGLNANTLRSRLQRLGLKRPPRD
ncbi:MAG: sigma 54-interacting transcriptional regulator [Gemmatimonadetes bacterium]|nr:sigma 54-interacting transcriptional regulator [Gemmatimonadota bacterium]MBT7862765.1 sigma 54-interacting transcriptional regulator [Gemmatimonadota bacterium]